MGRTVREVEAAMTGNELAEWCLFEKLYGLPDGFEVAGRVGQALAAVLAGKPADPGLFSPYLAALADQAEDDETEEEAARRNFETMQAIAGAMAAVATPKD